MLVPDTVLRQPLYGAPGPVAALTRRTGATHRRGGGWRPVSALGRRHQLVDTLAVEGHFLGAQVTVVGHGAQVIGLVPERLDSFQYILHRAAGDEGLDHL